jgi:hypothetical protein
MYVRGLEEGEMIKIEEGLELLIQASCGVALNEWMAEEGGMVHNDAKDYGINCAIPGENLQGEMWCC